jgi:hypothetical protein
MRKLITILAGLGLLVASAPALGGSLGDFKESYRETEDASDDDDDDDDDEGWSDWDEDDDCIDCNSAQPLDDVFRAILTPAFGYLPGERFSLGRTPYHGRGDPAVSAEIPELEHLTVESGWPGAYATAERDAQHDDPDRRHFQLTLRANGLATTQVDAVGAELFAKLSSTYMPGTAISYQYTGELDSDETLAIGYWVYEPNIFTEHMTLSWTIGAVTLGDQSSLDELGLTTGMALEIFPKDPVFLDFRASLHGFENVRIFDGRMGVGLLFTDQLGIELNMRHLNIIDGTSLTMVGLGLRSYLGI